ncbi:uncharacterized protein LOC116248392 [Nymphaea colorata]|nr:uncharacterized protein LOC116248392 [Nymphaea colorata]
MASDLDDGRRLDLVETVLNWSVEDIFNEDLLKDKVKEIPFEFSSVEDHLGSFIFPLVDDTRAELCSSLERIKDLPSAGIVMKKSKRQSCGYDVRIRFWETEYIVDYDKSDAVHVGDLVIISTLRPNQVSDLGRYGAAYFLALVTDVPEDMEFRRMLSIKASKCMKLTGGEEKFTSLKILMNLTTIKRIHTALKMQYANVNLKIIRNVLRVKSWEREACMICASEQCEDSFRESLVSSLSQYNLNDSQVSAISSAISTIKCTHSHAVKLIQGPPGTGKTNTVSKLLWTLLQQNFTILTCASTNVAIKEVASRVLKLVRDSNWGSRDYMHGCFLGDILLVGNKERLSLDVDDDLNEIFLDHRVARLSECLDLRTGWEHKLASMIKFLDTCAFEYNRCTADMDSKAAVCFVDFLRPRFDSIAVTLEDYAVIISTHLPREFISDLEIEYIDLLLKLLSHLRKLMSSMDSRSIELERIFSSPMNTDIPEISSTKNSLNDVFSEGATCRSLQVVRIACLDTLQYLKRSFKRSSIGRKDLLRCASLVFCTTSSAAFLHSFEINHLSVLVIDEAAQIKECESAIPLQLDGLRHAVLIGDERQLCATVKSKISEECGFGRSLFERLVLLGHSKDLLNVQYRMHPSISIFPNSAFYGKKILDGPNVRCAEYTKFYLPERMYSTYSFINVSEGKEIKDETGSWKNIVEVAVISQIVRRLFEAWVGKKDRLSIGIVSPYTAQVLAIQEKLIGLYDLHADFVLSVKSIDGYQGGETDVIILSTVRCNAGGSIGFLSNLNRANVALTRARYCLWVIGNESTLISSGSVWKHLVLDAKQRGFFFNAGECKFLAQVIIETKQELDQLDDLLSEDSVLFMHSRWKVVFSNEFKKSFMKLASLHTKKFIISFLLKLAGGWRPKMWMRTEESASQLVNHHKIEGLQLVWTVDVIKDSVLVQILKVWDILPPAGVPKLVKRLENIFLMYTDIYTNYCKTRHIQGKLVVPMTWEYSEGFVRYKAVGAVENYASEGPEASDLPVSMEKSNVHESLLLMKFYSLSYGVVKHLLTSKDGNEIELPFEVTDREQEIILFPNSTFILGRSGTGKTTALTMKLIQNEQNYRLASKGLSTNTLSLKEPVTIENPLRQMFVTVSQRLCSAVKNHVVKLQRVVLEGECSHVDDSAHLYDINDSLSELMNIPDSFTDVHDEQFPLVITFEKFLLMLDGTIPQSYFARFRDVTDIWLHEGGQSKSLALLAFIKRKEVVFDRFHSFYWPHFDAKKTKKLDALTVFSQIISHIKGGYESGAELDCTLSRSQYLMLSQKRVSTLNLEEREVIYDIFLDYEKRKLESGDFDLSDLIINLHYRLKNQPYRGKKLDFVFVDEVQDLTMRQIALFKYVCSNVCHGFIFAGDTAQTIAKGVDFRFQEIRSLFYREFLSEFSTFSMEKVKDRDLKMSDLFFLDQNFRTHDGVLKLARTVIELIYNFFPMSVDILSPEVSLICGEVPIVLESGSNENIMIKIFGGNGNFTAKFEGFGAEQVILVRDDCMKKLVVDHVGNQALVLTIVECKGLEFQDVLLYNFFSTSPLKNHWRVIYQFMEKKNLLNVHHPSGFPRFEETKHLILCSELKQLYVAITRTRQRLWFCETDDEFSKPMFDYWKSLGLVQTRQIDSSIIQSMGVASTAEEWKIRGIKLFNEGNFVMATMCFERAGDVYGAMMAKAASLEATGDHLLCTNICMATNVLTQAAEIYQTIGKMEAAANCYMKLQEYRIAGQIYMEKCGNERLEDAGDCFALATCWSEAADVYAKGKFFAKCLDSCKKGKLFNKGLDFIKLWKEVSAFEHDARNSGELDKVIREYLESCAFHYHELNDHKSMMKFVRALPFIDLKFFAKSLASCEKRELLVEGLNFIELWKEVSTHEREISEEFNRIIHDYLERCAFHYHELNDHKSMMKFVRALPFIDLKFFAKCLASCEKRELLDEGLNFIELWKEVSTHEREISEEFNRIIHDYLERCALLYHKRNDYKSMMKFVCAFPSMDLTRSFLRDRHCFGELLAIEKQCGNFLEAAKTAKMMGNLLSEAEMLEKAGCFGESSRLIIFHVVISSLWTSGSRGWPLKQFEQKDELIRKAKLLATMQPLASNESVFVEADFLARQETSFSELLQDFNTARRLGNIKLEALVYRGVLDLCCKVNPSRYSFESELVLNPLEHVTEMMLHNRTSPEVLVYFWNLFKNMILSVLQCIQSLEQNSGSELENYECFCLEYMGIQKLDDPKFYVAVKPEASWLKANGKSILCKKGNSYHLSSQHVQSCARKYWCSELVYVGFQVLEKLEALCTYSSQKSDRFSQGLVVLQVFDISSFLLRETPVEAKCHASKLHKLLGDSKFLFFNIIFPLDWQEGMSEKLLHLRQNDKALRLLDELIHEKVFHVKQNRMTHGWIGRLVVLLFLRGKFGDEHFELVKDRLNGMPIWRPFIVELKEYLGSRCVRPSFICAFAAALQCSYDANWTKEVDYISPQCFMFLIEQLVLLTSASQVSDDCWYCTKSIFCGLLMHSDFEPFVGLCSVGENVCPDTFLHTFNLVLKILEELLFQGGVTKEWIKMSGMNVSKYYPLLILQLVVCIVIIHVNSRSHFGVLCRLLNSPNILFILPKSFREQFCNAGSRLRVSNIHFLVGFAKALKAIDNPMVVMNLKNVNLQLLQQEALILTPELVQCRNNVLDVFFPKSTKRDSQMKNSSEDVVRNSACVDELVSDSPNMAEDDQKSNIEKKCDDLQGSFIQLWNMFIAFSSFVDDGNTRAEGFASTIESVKVAAEEFLHGASNFQNDQVDRVKDLPNEINNMLSELKQLSMAMQKCERSEEDAHFIKALCEQLQKHQPRLQQVVDSMIPREKGTDSTPSDVKTAPSQDNAASNKPNAKSKKSRKKCRQAAESAVAPQSESRNEQRPKNKSRNRRKK